MTSSLFTGQLGQWLFGSTIRSLLNHQIVRHKHYNPLFKRERRAKFIKIELPDFHKNYDNLTPAERRAEMKKKGLQPIRPWQEKPIYISSTGTVMEPFVPPEGDGKMSLISTTGAKQQYEIIQKKSKSMMAVRKIRSYDEDFSIKEFPLQAQDIYIKAHTCMMEKDEKNLIEYVTELCYPEMLYNIKGKTIRWKFLNSLEPPRVVHVRNVEMLNKENIFSQVTVRFHTQQQLAIYDRFGRLMYGSEILAKDVLEYVVFEKYISNVYGTWRVHQKIIPDWLPPRDPSRKTYVQEEEKASPEDSEPQDKGISKAIVDNEPISQSTSDTSTPRIAIA